MTAFQREMEDTWGLQSKCLDGKLETWRMVMCRPYILKYYFSPLPVVIGFWSRRYVYVVNTLMSLSSNMATANSLATVQSKRKSPETPIWPRNPDVRATKRWRKAQVAVVRGKTSTGVQTLIQQRSDRGKWCIFLFRFTQWQMCFKFETNDNNSSLYWKDQCKKLVYSYTSS